MYVYLPVSHREPVNFSGHAHPKDGKSASLKQIPPFKQGFEIHGSKIIINEIETNNTYLICIPGRSANV